MRRSVAIAHFTPPPPAATPRPPGIAPAHVGYELLPALAMGKHEGYHVPSSEDLQRRWGRDEQDPRGRAERHVPHGERGHQGGGPGRSHPGIRHGRLQLEGCDISSEAGSCLYVYRGADPVVRQNMINNGHEYGVFVYEGGRGTFEDNEIVGCRWANVRVQEGSTPVFRRNVIRDGVESGVRVLDTGLGVFEQTQRRPVPEPRVGRPPSPAGQLSPPEVRLAGQLG